ncbi:50S ribosomal protein L10 [Candidatus Parcubacteria bacterium]|nr:MAG: 50S ribosomal protein L10 [Candidatus Parcubacteria bacterium]
MPKTKEQKKQILDNLQEKLASSKAVVFSSDSGVTVQSVAALRKELRNSGAEYLVAKKTLLRMATKDVSGDSQVENLRGSVGLVLSYDDEISGAKIANKFAKTNEAFVLSGGILEGAFILPDMVQKLATLPTKDQLLAKLVGTLNSPISGMVGVLSGVPRSFVAVLSAIKEKK